MDSTPISDDERLGIVLAITGQIRWQSTSSGGDCRRRGSPAGPWTRSTRGSSILDALVTADEFPFVRRALDEGVFLPTPGGDPFAFGLERVLDGIEAVLASAPTRRGAAAAERGSGRAHECRTRSKYKEAVKARREVEKHLREARKTERETERKRAGARRARR